MGHIADQIRIEDMGIDERLALIERLWDSLEDTEQGTDQPIPEWHQQELEHRLAEADANPDAGIPWDEARARLLGPS